MKIRISVLFLWMICRCFGFHCCCDLHELKYDLEAKNLSLIIRNKEALLTWTCDIPAENFSNFSYFIYLKHEDWNFETEAACGEEVALTLPDHPSNPVCVRVNAVWNDDICQIESEICVDPGGTRTEESVECIVYNVSSMNCTWTFGKNIPYKTEYTLSLKQDVTVIDCPQYMNDPETRTGSCSFHDLTLDYFNDVTILLNGKGSESHRGIKEKFEPANKEIFNPPTNLTVMNSEDSLLLSWKRPGTQYPIPESCFQYQVERNKELFSDVHNPYSMSNFEKKCLIRIRARGDSTCGMNTNWGQWSDEISCDAPQKDNTELVILLVLLGLSAVIILFTIVINIQYKRIIKFFFPRIPQPKNYFGDVQV